MLDVDRNREWLRHGMNRPYEAVLSIRMKVDGAFIGVIGWSKGDPVERSLELGRVMVDARTLVRYRDVFPPGYAGVAVDAGTALRDFAFTTLGLELMRAVVIEANRLSQRAAVAGGARVVGTRTERRSDGSEVCLISLECSREEWMRLAGREHGAPRVGAVDPPMASPTSP
jgi:RimJ/RimL family protein N-acetyltransferase